MATSTTEAVIAGSRAFALALLAPLTERVGTRPRIAADPGQVLALCKGGSLVIVEFQGEGSLRAIQGLVAQGGGLRIVVAVPEAHLAAEGTLRALGIDLARWDGNPEGILGAVARQLASDDVPCAAPSTAAPQRAPTTSGTPLVARAKAAAPPPAPMRVEAPVPTPLAAGGLFDDLDDDEDFSVEVGDAAGSSPVGSALGAAPWPGDVPGPIEAADALGRGLAGDFDPAGSPLAAVAEVVGGLSELERAVFTGEPQPIDTDPIRRAAVMRVRVAAALATAPAGGGEVDAAAVSGLLVEIDALLSDVSAVAQGAPPELQASLEQVRNALVKEAIDFSEAAHRAASSQEVAPTPPAPRASARPTQTRMVSVASKAEVEIEAAEAKRHRSLWVVLSLALLVAGGYHGYSLWESRAPEIPLGVGPLSNAHMSEVPGGGKMVHARGGCLRPRGAEAARGRGGAEGEHRPRAGAGALSSVMPGLADRAPGRSHRERHARRSCRLRQLRSRGEHASRAPWLHARSSS